jgi:hypothetical protein
MHSNKGKNLKKLLLKPLSKIKATSFLFFFLCGILALGFYDPIDSEDTPFGADSVYKNGTDTFDTSLNKIQYLRGGISNPHLLPLEYSFYLIDFSKESYFEYSLFLSVFSYRAPPALF